MGPQGDGTSAAINSSYWGDVSGDVLQGAFCLLDAGLG